MLVFFLTTMPTPARADEEVPGSFDVEGEAPTVESVELCTAGGSATTDMTPQVEYNISVNVSDTNTLDDLSTVTVTIFYDADGAYSDDEVAGAADNQTRAILTWTNGGSWSIDPVADGTSWVLESCVEPTLSVGSGIFEFHFKPGKVATETTGNAKWHIYAEAYDGTATDNATDVNKDMNWYGEITVNGLSSVDWGALVPGTDFGPSSNKTDISVTYIANGAYEEQVATSANWTGNSDNATLDATGSCTYSNEFSLKADDTTTLDDAVLVTATPGGYATIDTNNQTGESGDTVTTNTLWLKLSSAFFAGDYSGFIYFKIDGGS